MSPTPHSLRRRPRESSKRPSLEPGRRRAPAVAIAAVAGALVFAGCGDTAGQVVGDVVDRAATGSACAAIGGVQEQLAGLDLGQISPDQISQLRTGAEFVSTAVATLGGGLPTEVGERLESAQQRLDAAADSAGSSADEGGADVADAVTGYASQLDDVAADLGC